MSHLSRTQRVELFMSLFKGRADVYAQRWEKFDGSASGYFPVHKDKSKKEYAPITEQIVEKHLIGTKTIGVYPLLSDNTSWFVAADFDGKAWLKSAKRLLAVCEKHNLPGYVERSRSGNGGHVWFFFTKAYPAYRSRKVFLHLIKESNNVGKFDKAESFDRLLPNQDYLSGKGLGNLIALPLQGIPRKSGNSVFLDPEQNFEVAPDQWEFLNDVERISPDMLDILFEKFTNQKEETKSKKSSITKGKLPITISKYISIPKSAISKPLANFLTEELNFFNTEFAVKQRMGLATYNLERYFKTIKEDDEEIYIPRGFFAKLSEYLTENNISFVIDDNRNKLRPVTFKPSFELRDYQEEAVESFKCIDQGILVAPPGAGKTIMGLALIAQKKQPALILVHRKQIYNQWIERIENFFGIQKRKIGQYTSTKKESQSITVAMIHTLSRMKDLSEIAPHFGTILVDECHHMPAKMFRSVITQFNPYYLYGLTATPTRKHNDEKLIYIYLGEIVHEVPQNYKQLSSKKSSIKEVAHEIQVKIRETKLAIPFKVKSTEFQTLAKILIFDAQRNQLIAKDVAKEAKKGKKCLILTERTDHVDMLAFYLRRDFEVITLVGTLTPKKKKEKEQQLMSGHYQIAIATGQLLGEGTSLDNLDCLFIVFPFSYTGKLIQYIGRIQHGKSPVKTIYDYRDKGVDFLERMFKKREKYYTTIST